MSPLKILAALLIISSGIALFTVDHPKLFALLLIAGSLLNIFDSRRNRNE